MTVYHIVALFCNRCVLWFVADDVWKCPFCRLKQVEGNDVVNRHYSRKLLKMDILMFETC